MSNGLIGLIDNQFSEFNRTAKQSIRTIINPNPQIKPNAFASSPSSSGSNLSVVTGVNTNQESYLAGNVTIQASGGLVSTQAQDAITLTAPQVFSASCNLYDQSSYQMQLPLNLRRINLVRFVTNGRMVVKRIRLAAAIVDGQNPNNYSDLIDIAVYSLESSSFTRELHFGKRPYIEFNTISGNTKYLDITSSLDINQGEYWLGWQFYGSAISDYSFALANTNEAILTTNSYQIATADDSELPATLNKPTVQSNASQIIWFELE